MTQYCIMQLTHRLTACLRFVTLTQMPLWGTSQTRRTLFGANPLGQQAGIWFELSALTQIAFDDFTYPPTVGRNCFMSIGKVAKNEFEDICMP